MPIQNPLKKLTRAHGLGEPVGNVGGLG